MVHVVIMADGGGTRFWPESKRNRSKQLQKITCDKAMIRATIEQTGVYFGEDDIELFQEDFGKE